MPWTFARVGDRDAELVAEPVDRDRDDPLQRPQGNLLGGVGRDALLCEVDERQVEAPRQRPRDAVGRRDALDGERLRQRADACATSGGCKTVGRDDVGRRDELGHEIVDRGEPEVDGGARQPRRCRVRRSRSRSTLRSCGVGST